MLTEYLESRLEERLQQEVGRHLMDCRRCAQELETLQIAVGALHELTPEPAPPGFAEGVSRRLHSPASPWTPRYWRLSWKPAAWVAPALAASAVVAMAIWLLPQQFSREQTRVARAPEGARSYAAPRAMTAPPLGGPEQQRGTAPNLSVPSGPVYPPRSAVPALPPAEAADKPPEAPPASPSAESFGRAGPAAGSQNGAPGAMEPLREHEAAPKASLSGDSSLRTLGSQSPAGPAGPAGADAAPAPRAEYNEIPQHAPTLSETRPSALDSAILPAVTARVTDGPAPKVRLALLRVRDGRATGEESVTRRVEPAAAAGKAEPELEPAEVSDAKWPGLVTVRITAPPAVAGHYLLALPAQERLGKDTDRVLTRAYERMRIREILADLSSASGLVILAPDPGLALLDLRLRDTTVDQALSLIASSRNEVVFADGAARTLLPARTAGSAR